MGAPLLFLLCPEAALPGDGVDLAGLRAAQAQGPADGFALRIFSLGRNQVADLSALPLDGRLTGTRRRSPDGTQLLCDAVVPHLEAETLWLGVFHPVDPGGCRYACLDQLALREASNETCWFYPSHDGAFLSWERGLRLSLAPGAVAAAGGEQGPDTYDRGRIAVLWSLLGDRGDLTCVGLTYGGQRIDWPLDGVVPEPKATWSRFRIDNQAEVPVLVQNTWSVATGGTGS